MTTTRMVLRWLMAAFYLAAGAGHLLRPDAFLPIVPDVVPFPRDVILLTGACEIGGAIALVTTRLRRHAGIILALYALCVWPAHVKHAVDWLWRQRLVPVRRGCSPDERSDIRQRPLQL